MAKPLFTTRNWDEPLLEKIWKVIDKVAREKFGLSYYPNPVMEIVSYDQMIYYSTNNGLPIMYDHWSQGMEYLKDQKNYRRGKHGLAYEMIINTNPLRAYLMDTNSATMQTLVLCHAICGHGHVFTNNYLFKEWTIADYILDYMKFAKNYIEQCEEKYGADEVEELLDCCHALKLYGVDKYKRPGQLKEDEIMLKYTTQKDFIESQTSELSEGQLQKPKCLDEVRENLERIVPEENLLYFIEKNSKTLQPWEKEIVRIVRKIAQYFYPQMQCKMLHEGFASFIHYEMMTELYDQGYLTDGSYLEFLDNHTAVCCCHTNEINVYAVGYAMFKDIKRMCQEPDEEDKRLFPDVVGKDYMEVAKDIVANYRDETFILQFLSPKIVKEFKLFTLTNDTTSEYYEIEHVHSDIDFKRLRETLANQWAINNLLPQIELVEDSYGDYALMHTRHDGVLLEEDSMFATLNAFETLYGDEIELHLAKENDNE